jgi:hypothetical protein
MALLSTTAEPDQRRIYEAFSDHGEFCRQSLMVSLKVGGLLVTMEPSAAQRRLNAAVKKQREAERAVRIVNLKARQVKVTTGVASQFFQDTAFRAGRHTAVIAHNEEAAIGVFQRYRIFADNYKRFGGIIKIPKRIKDAEDALSWDNGSWIKVKSASSAHFGRSFTLHNLQLDEFAFYEDSATLMTGIMQAVPNDPDTNIIIPSTANGLGNPFHKLWQRVMDPANTESDFVGVFFAWWEEPEYSMPLVLPRDRFQHSLDEEEREEMGRYSLRLEQLQWRRWCIENNCEGSIDRFHQEYPSNPEQAFISSGRPRFDLRAIARHSAVADAPRGDLEIVTYGGERRIVFGQKDRGALVIYRRPQPGRHYVIGADVSEGIDANMGDGNPDADFSVAPVFDRDTGEQVAVWRGRVQPAEFGRTLDALARWYNNAGVVPEANGPGLACIDELLRAGYPSGLIYHRRDAPDGDPWTRSDLIGWKTTQVTRPQLVSKVDAALREGSIILHDPITISELNTFVIKTTGKAEAQSGCHDDCVIGLGLALVGIAEMPRPAAVRGEFQGRPEVQKYGGGGERPGRGRQRR